VETPEDTIPGSARTLTVSPRDQSFTLAFRWQQFQPSERAFRHHSRSSLPFQQLQDVRSQVQNAENLRDSRARDAGKVCSSEQPPVRARWSLYGSLYAGLGIEQMFWWLRVPGQIPNFLPVEVTLRVDCGKKRRAGEKRHYFSWEELPPRCSEPNENAPAPRANRLRVAARLEACNGRAWRVADRSRTTAPVASSLPNRP